MVHYEISSKDSHVQDLRYKNRPTAIYKATCKDISEVILQRC